jgi:hypothetical protein
MDRPFLDYFNLLSFCPENQLTGRTLPPRSSRGDQDAQRRFANESITPVPGSFGFMTLVSLLLHVSGQHAEIAALVRCRDHKKTGMHERNVVCGNGLEIASWFD